MLIHFLLYPFAVSLRIAVIRVPYYFPLDENELWIPVIPIMCSPTCRQQIYLSVMCSLARKVIPVCTLFHLTLMTITKLQYAVCVVLWKGS